MQNLGVYVLGFRRARKQWESSGESTDKGKQEQIFVRAVSFGLASALSWLTLHVANFGLIHSAKALCTQILFGYSHRYT